MGTNYYIKEKDDCKECGRPFEKMHVGKSSGGWMFALDATEIKTTAQWFEKIKSSDGLIEDEYGRPISSHDLLELIDSKKGDHWETDRDTAIDGPCRLIFREFR